MTIPEGLDRTLSTVLAGLATFFITLGIRMNRKARKINTNRLDLLDIKIDSLKYGLVKALNQPEERKGDVLEYEFKERYKQLLSERNFTQGHIDTEG